MSLRVIFLGLFQTVTPVALAQRGASPWQGRLLAPDGAPTTLMTVAKHERMLVLFWASWCEPCRAELARVAAARERLAPLDVVAVSVDDPAGWTTAQALLAAIGWPFVSLWDDGGVLFNVLSPSGQLPLALMLDRHGDVLSRYEELDLALLEGPGQAEHATPWSFSDQVDSRMQRVSGGGAPAAAVANEASALWRARPWTAQLTHDAVRERAPGDAGWRRPADEVGFSFVEWRPDAAPAGLAMLRARLGDDAAGILGGSLLEARRRPEINEAASVAGAHAEAGYGPLSVLAGAGELRDRLFPFDLDPTTDLAAPAPKERAAYLQAAATGPGGTRLVLGTVRYGELADRYAGVPGARWDERAGAQASWGGASRGVDLLACAYHPDGELPRGRAAGFGIRLPLASSAGLTLNGLRSNDRPARTFLPELTEEPFLPLALADRQVVRMAPMVALGTNGLATLSLVDDRDAAENGGRTADHQGTALLKWVGFGSGLEARAGRQAGRSATLGRNYTEDAAGGGLDVVPAVHASVLGQRYEASGRPGAAPAGAGDRGERLSSRVDANLSSLLGLGGGRRATAAASVVHQTDHYVDLSRLAARRLAAVELGFGTHEISARLAIGQEPGGLVCSGGSCTPRAPLDGASLSLRADVGF